jgi:hypothetical protein
LAEKARRKLLRTVHKKAVCVQSWVQLSFFDAIKPDGR